MSAKTNAKLQLAHTLCFLALISENATFSDSLTCASPESGHMMMTPALLSRTPRNSAGSTVACKQMQARSGYYILKTDCLTCAKSGTKLPCS